MSQQEQKQQQQSTSDNKTPEKPAKDNDEEKKDAPINPLDAEEIKLIKRYGQGAYFTKM